MPKIPVAPEPQRRTAAAPTARRAAASGPAAGIARLQARAGNAAVAARLRDDQDVPIDIGRIPTLGAVKDAQGHLRSGFYRRDPGDDEALTRRATELRQTIKEQTADETVNTMDALNHGRVMYYHNAVRGFDALTRRLELDGFDPANGYADPNRFVRVSPFTWVLRARVSASAALHAFLNPGAGITIVECQSAAQAALYNSILSAVGRERFDARFGRADEDTPEEHRLKLQKDLDSRTNPLQAYLRAGQEVYVRDDDEANELVETGTGDIVSAPGHRPVRRGGWYYVAGHRDYAKRHPRGIWGGENAIYVGQDRDGVQRFSGFGMDDVTEAELADHLAEDFCREPTAAEQDLIFFGIRPSEWSLVLPRLGDSRSVDQLVPSDRAIESIDNAWSFHNNKRALPLSQDPVVQAREKVRQIIEAAGPLVQPIRAADLLRTVSVLRHRDAPAPPPVVARLGSWNAPVRGPVTLTLSGQIRLSLGSFADRYAVQFGINRAPELERAIRTLNPDVFPVSPQSLKLYRAGTMLSFPNTDSVSKLVAMPGGVQSFGEKLLAIDRIGELADRAV